MKKPRIATLIALQLSLLFPTLASASDELMVMDSTGKVYKLGTTEGGVFSRAKAKWIPMDSAELQDPYFWTGPSARVTADGHVEKRLGGGAYVTTSLNPAGQGVIYKNP